MNEELMNKLKPGDKIRLLRNWKTFDGIEYRDVTVADPPLVNWPAGSTLISYYIDLPNGVRMQTSIYPEDAVFWKHGQSEGPKGCVCNINSLMIRGCTCGGV